MYVFVLYDQSTSIRLRNIINQLATSISLVLCSRPRSLYCHRPSSPCEGGSGPLVSLSMRSRCTLLILAAPACLGVLTFRLGAFSIMRLIRKKYLPKKLHAPMSSLWFPHPKHVLLCIASHRRPLRHSLTSTFRLHLPRIVKGFAYQLKRTQQLGFFNISQVNPHRGYFAVEFRISSSARSQKESMNRMKGVNEFKSKEQF